MLGAQNCTLSTHFLNYFVLGLFLPISSLPFFAFQMRAVNEKHHHFHNFCLWESL